LFVEIAVRELNRMQIAYMCKSNNDIT